jgi:hypothetical protein
METTMKKLLFIAAACLLAAACTPQDGGGETASLEVSPKSLTFGAEDTTPQEITVTATGVEWEYAVPSSADWITVDDGTAGKLLVSVTKNPTAEKRTASIRITAKDNDDLEPVSVTVTQAGSETPEVYSLTVDPAALTFEAEGAAGQSVKVTASGEGITWSAAIDEAAKEWITLSATEGAEGETTLTVTVQDNPDTAERSANVTLTPSVESVGPKAIRVTQEAKVLPPSLAITYDGGKELPEEGFVMGYRGRLITLALVPVNLTWKAEADAEWLKITVNTDYNLLTIAMSDVLNTSSESRSCNIIVTTDAEGVGPFKIPVTQEGQPEFQSTILEDMELTTLTHCYVAVTPNCDWRDKPFTQWDMRFMSENVSYANNLGNYSGTGDRLTVDLVSEPIWVNDDAEYYLPDGTYTVVANFNSDENLRVPGSVSAGAFTFSHPRFTNGTWYVRIEDDAYPGGQAAITEGTMTVSRTGEEYVITFEFVSDAGFAVTGTYEGTLELHPDA